MEKRTEQYGQFLLFAAVIFKLDIIMNVEKYYDRVVKSTKIDIDFDGEEYERTVRKVYSDFGGAEDLHYHYGDEMKEENKSCLDHLLTHGSTHHKDRHLFRYLGNYIISQEEIPDKIVIKSFIVGDTLIKLAEPLSLTADDCESHVKNDFYTVFDDTIESEKSKLRNMVAGAIEGIERVEDKMQNRNIIQIGKEIDDLITKFRVAIDHASINTDDIYSDLARVKRELGN